ncbi:hypothetical protein PCURB6_34110 [Paenibacillus curdlanolyticus]|nr:hypothetical protein PCURB6_34110 [Paenibacillus curdlanolyticus]
MKIALSLIASWGLFGVRLMQGYFFDLFTRRYTKLPFQVGLWPFWAEIVNINSINWCSSVG